MDYHHGDEVYRSSQGHGLFLGDIQAAEDIDWLRENNIRTGKASPIQSSPPPRAGSSSTTKTSNTSPTTSKTRNPKMPAYTSIWPASKLTNVLLAPSRPQNQRCTRALRSWSLQGNSVIYSVHHFGYRLPHQIQKHDLSIIPKDAKNQEALYMSQPRFLTTAKSLLKITFLPLAHFHVVHSQKVEEGEVTPARPNKMQSDAHHNLQQQLQSVVYRQERTIEQHPSSQKYEHKYE